MLSVIVLLLSCGCPYYVFLPCGAEDCSLVYDSYISLSFWPEYADGKISICIRCSHAEKQLFWRLVDRGVYL